MGSSNLSSALLPIILILAISSSPLALACATPKAPKSSPKSPKGSPITLPPIPVPPVIGMPPVNLPPILPPIMGKPPVTMPPVTMPPITVPPITVPTVPIIGGGSPPATKSPGGCGSPPAPPKCPVDALKFGGCLDVLGETIKFGDPAVACCAPLEGIAGLDAAMCLCTTIKAKFMNVNVVLPLALQVLVNTCGKSIPPGYTCP
ncbi:hypothetical protein Cni_G29115 [Canna indica]|uniref:Bifunctional inhibitor/plant lipid transfer protein/seed storage helical domain-containing protein n=1 Tax=Canna indica TaxID=4628 RepID=A0AAQ3QSX7_9LILI|nr:hypothetical protein Cni_G29115 [Canna indica]